MNRGVRVRDEGGGRVYGGVRDNHQWRNTDEGVRSYGGTVWHMA